MAQTFFTTAELALHYKGLGVGPPTSSVQNVKHLPSLPDYLNFGILAFLVGFGHNRSRQFEQEEFS